MRRAIDDAEAVTRARGGDLDAFAVMVARYTLRAHRAAFLLGAGEEADDVVQEAFVKAFRHLSRFRAGEPFGPWLLRIVANETRNLTRSRRRREALALRLCIPEPGTAGTGVPLLPRPVRGGDRAGAGVAARVGEIAHGARAEQASRGGSARGAELGLQWLTGPGGGTWWSPSCGRQ